MLAYQGRWFRDRSRVKIFAKSRQIGITWTTAAEAVFVAQARGGAGGGMNVYFMSMSRDDARDFIDMCAWWIERLRPTMQGLVNAGKIEPGDWLRNDEKEEEIQAFRIRFPSGFSIYALPSKPSRLRGKTGLGIFDEAAQQDLQAIRKAATAFMVHGGRLAYISTYLGVDNDFYRLVESARDPKSRRSLHEMNFEQALADGLYRRICRKSGIPWSPEAEIEYTAMLREEAEDAWDEEFMLVVDRAGGQEFPRTLVQSCAKVGPDQCTIVEITARRGPCEFWVNGELVATSARSWESGQASPEERTREIERWLDAHVSPVLARITDDGHDVHAGLDYARTVNLSSFTLLTRMRTNARRMRLLIELDQIPWDEQDTIQNYLWPRLPNLKAGAGDKGGPGGPSVERAGERTGGRIVAVPITDDWHARQWIRLRKRFEQGMIEVPFHYKPLEDDLASIRRARGRIRPIAAKVDRRGQARHADSAVSLALAEQSIEIEPAESIRPPRQSRRRRSRLPRGMR